MHPGQLDVTTDLVTRLVRSQFPEWSGLRVSGVRSHGTVNALFRIGDDLVARFPIQPGDPAEVLKELEPGNLLAQNGRLAGVIDVGTFTVADPAIDLAPAWNLLDAETRTAFRTALGSDDDEWRRGMGWSFAQAIGCLWYYVETNPVMSRTAHHTLTALLAAA
jgi:aminoglycoside phosphotransferase (APT) family kinase protein